MYYVKSELRCCHLTTQVRRRSGGRQKHWLLCYEWVGPHNNENALHHTSDNASLITDDSTVYVHVINTENIKGPH